MSCFLARNSEQLDQSLELSRDGPNLLAQVRKGIGFYTPTAA